MHVILFISFGLAVAFYLNQSLADPDLWWHIVSGRRIISTLEFPHQDYWLAFSEGKPWQAYSWSNEIVYAVIDRYFGIEGLLVLQMLLAVSFVFSVSFVFGKLAQNYYFGSLVGFFVALGCSGHFSLRPQTFVWILLAFLLLVSESIRGSRNNKRNFIWLFLIFCLWANTHITTVLGLFVLLFWLLPTSSKIALSALAVGFIGTLFTPYVGAEWLTFISKTGHPFKFANIQEFSPSTIFNSASAVLILLLALSACFWLKDKKSLRLGQLKAVVILSLGGAAVIKFMPFALIVGGALVSLQWARIGNSITEEVGLVQGLQKLFGLIDRIPKEGLSFVLVCIAIVNANHAWISLIDGSSLPVRPMDIFISQKLDGPILNTFGDGGYISYRLSDIKGDVSSKPSIDGRTNLISPIRWKEYQQAWNGSWDWEKHVADVNPETIIWRSDSALVRLLETRGDWCVVYGKNFPPGGSVLMLKKDRVQSKGLSCQ